MKKKRSASPPSPELSQTKKWVFALVGFVLLPLLVLVGAEVALRAFGYGYSIKFFKPLRIGTRDYLVENDKFGLRFFPPEVARSPAPVVMEARKLPGTYRIFVAGKYAARKLELNSSECESWLSWSSNSRWVVFSSKRISPLFNRPHISYVSPTGECSKPFILPQEDPEFYDSLLKTFTIPTLAKGPITVPESDLVYAIKHSGHRPLSMPAVQVVDPAQH